MSHYPICFLILECWKKNLDETYHHRPQRKLKVPQKLSFSHGRGLRL